MPANAKDGDRRVAACTSGTAADALRREIREELGCDVRVATAPAVIENLYDHHGSPGHEIIFAFEMGLVQPTIPTEGRFALHEDDGSLHWADWVEISRFAERRDSLFPIGLAAWLQHSPST